MKRVLMATLSVLALSTAPAIASAPNIPPTNPPKAVINPATPAIDVEKPAAKMPAIEAMTLSQNSRSRLDRNSSYPAYCVPIPNGLNEQSFAYREALNNCLYGL